MKSTIVLLLSFIFLNSYSQSLLSDNFDQEYDFSKVEIKPFFKSFKDQKIGFVYEQGEKGLLKFIFNNLTYPPKARDKKIQGISVIKFVINKEGNLQNIKLIRGFNDDCDNEALRVIGLMQDEKMWSPGLNNGKVVNVSFTLPIKFVIQ